MYQRRRARILVAVLVVVALALVTIDFRGGDDGPLGGLRGTVTSVLQPVQDGVGVLVRPFGDAASSIGDLFNTRSENRQLREQVEALEERRTVVTDLERENEELRGLLDIRDRTELDTVTARTVALSPSNFEWTITIDVGAEDGLERDMPVINGDGLVGRVIQVTPNASVVLLAIDPNFSAGARTARTAEIGLIDGRGGEPMSLQLLDPEADVETGDEIVTSSYQGGVFPAGIPIGTVAAVADTETGLSREVRVSPYVDFTRLHHVMVVLSSPVEEVPDFEGTDGLEFRRPDVDPTVDPDDLEDEDEEGDDADGDGDDAEGEDEESDDADGDDGADDEAAAGAEPEGAA